MIDGQFDVVFRGQIIKTMSLDEVKVNLGNLFKSSPEAIEKLFNGGEVAIKKSLDYTTAMKYQSAIKKTGALALIKEVETETVAKIIRQSQSQSQGRATFGTASESMEKKPADSEITAPAQQPSTPIEVTQPVSVAASSPAQNEEGAMTLANVGIQLMPDKIYEKRDIDTSEFSLAVAGERLLPPKAPENYKQPSIEHLKLE